jgi:RNA polymerase sigma factor (sigma-70 family)
MLSIYDTPEFLSMVKSGDRLAFMIVYNETVGHLTSYANSVYKQFSKEEKEDLISNAYYILWRNKEWVKDFDYIPSALFKYFKNQAIDLFRKKKAEINYVHYTQTHCKETDEPPESTDYYGEIRKEVMLLPIRQRKVITMRFYEGRPIPEIAELLGVTKQTVVNTSTIAINKLIKKLPFSGNKVLTKIRI